LSILDNVIFYIVWTLPAHPKVFRNKPLVSKKLKNPHEGGLVELNIFRMIQR